MVFISMAMLPDLLQLDPVFYITTLVTMKFILGLSLHLHIPADIRISLGVYLMELVPPHTGELLLIYPSSRGTASRGMAII